jgi:MtN3 and saliva related transmembrane protein
VLFETFIGGAAAFCTTVSYVPQLKKVWATGEAADLSLKMLLLLGSGLTLWIVYGIRGDLVIIVANAVSVSLLSCITYLKLRGRKRGSG